MGRALRALVKLPVLNLRTDAAVQMIPQFELDGSTVGVVIIKQRFAIEDRGGVRRIPGAQVLVADIPWDADTPSSSIRYPSDLCIRKPSTDVIVTGEAVSERRVPVTELDVLVRVGPIEKIVRVFGTRVWYRTAGGLGLTAPQPFTSVPLKWELAFGGTDSSDPRRAVTEPRNPVGRGVAADPATLVHKPGPQLEDPRHLVTGARARPAPAGLGAIGAHFAPRIGYAGTMNDRWAKERMPLRPVDFDERHNQAAPPDQITPHPLRGGERVQLLHLCEWGAMQFNLPRLAFGVVAVGEAGEVEHPATLDTVMLEPSALTFDLTWRAAIPTPARRRAVESVRVFEKRVL